MEQAIDGKTRATGPGPGPRAIPAAGQIWAGSLITGGPSQGPDNSSRGARWTGPGRDQALGSTIS